MKKRVLVGMSGGVDSSAACMLLQEQGYEVVGLTLRTWDVPTQFSSSQQSEPNHVLDARELSAKLGIEHHTLDVRTAFRASVVQYFIDEYLAGNTPNPCVMCNLHFKWKSLLEQADLLGCQYVATGHYARIREEEGNYFLFKGLDSTKDQSYFLWRLGNEQLSRTIFPLGEWLKADVKKYVLARGYKEKAEKKESMEICFIENDYRDFLNAERPDLAKKVAGGSFVDTCGKQIGKHAGFPYFTVGQRKGLNIALGYPAYITRIDARNNTIVLGKREELFTQTAWVDIDNALPLRPYIATDKTLEVRIRYRSAALSCTIEQLTDTRFMLHFLVPASAVTPGQSAVFYSGDKVLTGGILCVAE